MSVKYISLLEEEVFEIDQLLDEILAGSSTIEVEQFLSIVHIYSQELPRRLRYSFYDFKTKESSSSLCIQNYPINDHEIGPTPTVLRDKPGAYFANRPDILHLLFSSLLGEAIGWTSQQAGHILNDIVPVKEREYTLSGSGSSALFDLHTEDAFHPYAADFLGLMCLRNPDGVPTILSSITDFQLDEGIKGILFQPRFYVQANYAQAVNQTAEKVSILFGHPDSPYMRANLNIQYADPDDKEGSHALQVFSEQLTKYRRAIILEPGSFLYIDNFKAAHGRYAYHPRYDGTDRWLKRLTITAYLRKSRDIRASVESHVYIIR